MENNNRGQYCEESIEKRPRRQRAGQRASLRQDYTALKDLE